MTPDDEYAAVLLRPLGDEPPTPPAPSTVDIGRAVLDGRRRRRVRRRIQYTTCGAAVVILIAAISFAVPAIRERRPGGGPPLAGPAASVEPSPSATAVPVPTTCSVTTLEPPSPGQLVEATGADPTGRYIVGRTSAGLVIWENLVAHKLPMSYPNARINDVNSAGTVVGVLGGEDAVRSFAYSSGDGLRQLRPASIEAVAINAGGMIIGNDPKRLHPYLWRTVDSAPEELSLPPSVKFAEVHDIDDDGTIVGMVNNLPYAWLPDGTGQWLPLLLSDFSTDYSAQRIRNGWVTGQVSDADRDNPTYLTVTWKLPATSATVRKEFRLGPVVVNNQGWLAGQGDGQAVLVTPNGTVELPQPESRASSAPPAGRSADPVPVAISDAAYPLTIVGGGGGLALKNGWSALLWTCR